MDENTYLFLKNQFIQIKSNIFGLLLYTVSVQLSDLYKFDENNGILSFVSFAGFGSRTEYLFDTTFSLLHALSFE